MYLFCFEILGGTFCFSLCTAIANPIKLGKIVDERGQVTPFIFSTSFVITNVTVNTFIEKLKSIYVLSVVWIYDI